jgi:hypothetical protein
MIFPRLRIDAVFVWHTVNLPDLLINVNMVRVSPKVKIESLNTVPKRSFKLSFCLYYDFLSVFPPGRRPYGPEAACSAVRFLICYRLYEIVY